LLALNKRDGMGTYFLKTETKTLVGAETLTRPRIWSISAVFPNVKMTSSVIRGELKAKLDKKI